MPSFTQTHTTICPNCKGENDAEITFDYSPEQKGGAWTEHIPLQLEDATVAPVFCWWCQTNYSDETLDVIAKTVEPRVEEND